jgi:ABC-type antimicrobial peptide transport system permease subunit
MDAIKGFVAIFSVTAVATAVFVYFVMRSKMMSDIYNIGVYRSLGASRLRINNKYLTDIFILATFTCLIGYILGNIGYVAVGEVINPFFTTYAGSKIIVYNFGISFLGILALYAIMYIFGMLPILMLERKTPSEIIAKYDI